MKKAAFIFSFIFIAFFANAQEVRPVKNVILMIADGTSIDVLSAARWYKFYNKMGDGLHIDPYLSGTVRTFSSNAPIGDSAPTTSCFMTGVIQQSGNIAIYPKADPDNDLYPVDASKTYQPATTLLEAMQIEQGKSAGLVATCEFPHATPADCSAHHYNRGNYKAIAPQMAYQNLDVVFAGGTRIVSNDMKKHFRKNGTTYIENDKNAMMNFSGNRVWALFGNRAQPYDIDRDPTQVPSIDEMTQKALTILSKNPNGFFLMVEGSKVDWAAHANDPVGIITDFLAFDKAIGSVIDFAKKNGETVVLITSDHGNSGFSIGKNDCHGYDKISIEQLFGTVSNIKLTASGLEAILKKTPPEKIKAVFKHYTDIDITDDELKNLLEAKNYKVGNYMNVSNSKNLTKHIIDVFNTHMCFGFTTGGHTGEEVFLATYHPQGDFLMGHKKNTEVNDYLYKASGLKTPLSVYSDKLFATHTDVFNGQRYSIDKKDKDFPVLEITKGQNRLQIRAFSSVATLNGKPFDIGSVVVYIDKNDTFYLPKSLADKL